VLFRSSSPFTPANSGNTYTVTYYKQISKQFSFSVSDGSSGYSPPILTCASLGTQSSCATLTAAPSTSWLDFGSAWSAGNPLAGSTTAERWNGNNASGTASTGASVVVKYYHQFSVTAGYTVVGGGTPSPSPSVTYKAYGSVVTASTGQTAKSFWMDAGQSFSVVTGSGTSNERWASPVSSFAVSSGASYTIKLYHQYSVQLSYTVVGGGTGYTPPALSFSNFTLTASVVLKQTSLAVWVDSGAQWAVTNPLSGGGPTERWQTNQTTTGQTSAAVSGTLVYYHQYLTSFGHTVVGGGSGYSAPAVTFAEFGVNVFGTQGWTDSGSRYNFTDPLLGSSSNERWYTGSGSGIIVKSATVNAT
jgi:hypothetical protein